MTMNCRTGVKRSLRQGCEVPRTEVIRVPAVIIKTEVIKSPPSNPLYFYGIFQRHFQTLRELPKPFLAKVGALLINV
jgi:hypothetical protein